MTAITNQSAGRKVQIVYGSVTAFDQSISRLPSPEEARWVPSILKRWHDPAPVFLFRRSLINPTHQHLFNSDKSQYREHTPSGT